MARYTTKNTQGQRVLVWLDGKEMRDVVMADTDAGVIERRVRDADGRIALDGDNIRTEVLIGRVEVSVQRRCAVCHGSGVIRCACWPGDCICGCDDDVCEGCDGAGYFYLDEDEAHP